MPWVAVLMLRTSSWRLAVGKAVFKIHLSTNELMVYFS